MANIRFLVLIGLLLFGFAIPAGSDPVLLGTARYQGGGGRSDGNYLEVRTVSLEFGYLGSFGGDCGYPRVGCAHVSVEQIVPGAEWEWNAANSPHFGDVVEVLTNGNDDQYLMMTTLYDAAGGQLFGGGGGRYESDQRPGAPDWAGFEITSFRLRVNVFSLSNSCCPGNTGIQYDADLTWEFWGVPASDASPTIELLHLGFSDTLYVGRPFRIEWVANDDHQVTSIDIDVTRDGGVSFEPIAAGIANTGFYVWTPTESTLDEYGRIVFSRYLRVRAHDDAGHSGVDLGGGFGIAEGTTPALVSGLRAEPEGAGIRVRWRLDPGADVREIRLERSTAAAGPWKEIPARVRGGEEFREAMDSEVVPGTSYFYRLALRLTHGEWIVYGPVEAVATRPAIEVMAIVPNPTPGPARVSFALEREAEVLLTVLDLQGREITQLVAGRLGPGSHEAVWNGASSEVATPAGVYFVRLEAGGRVSQRRIVRTK